MLHGNNLWAAHGTLLQGTCKKFGKYVEFRLSGLVAKLQNDSPMTLKDRRVFGPVRTAPLLHRIIIFRDQAKNPVRLIRWLQLG
jgi:hypothetical protein